MPHATELIAVIALGLTLAFICGMVAQRLRLPPLVGYLVAGILAGPHLLHLVDHGTVERLSVINTLTLALIALAGGAELRIEDLRQGLKSLGWSMLIHSTLGFVVMSVLFVALARWLPFTQGLSFAAVIGIGLLWGVVAVSRSPSAGAPLGPLRLAGIARAAGLPVYALGGVNDATAGRLRSLRLAGLAAVEGFRT